MASNGIDGAGAARHPGAGRAGTNKEVPAGSAGQLALAQHPGANRAGTNKEVPAGDAG